MADVGHYMVTKSVFYTPPLLKTNASGFPVSIVLMLVSLNYCQFEHYNTLDITTYNTTSIWTFYTIQHCVKMQKSIRHDT